MMVGQNVCDFLNFPPTLSTIIHQSTTVKIWKAKYRENVDENGKKCSYVLQALFLAGKNITLGKDKLDTHHREFPTSTSMVKK